MMNDEQFKKITNEVEDLAASISNLTSTLSLLAEVNSERKDNQIGAAFFLLADCSKRFEDEAYRIWETMRGDRDVAN